MRLLIILSLLLTACTPKWSKITLSYGGGFSGFYEKMEILPNGDVLLRQEPDSFRRIQKLNKKQINELSQSVKQLENIEIQEPDNMTITLRIRLEKEERLLSWNSDSKIPAPLSELLQLLQKWMPEYYFIPEPSRPIKITP